MTGPAWRRGSKTWTPPFTRTNRTYEVRSRLLKENGQQIPDRVEYVAYAAEWPSQDIATIYGDMDRKVGIME